MAKRKPLLDPAAQAFLRGEAPPAAAPPAAPPAPRAAADATIRFTVDLDPEQHRRLRVAAAERGVRMSVIAREALDAWLSNG